MCKFPMEFDLLSDRRFILTKSLCDSGLCRTVGNTGKNDTSFLQRQMGKSIFRIHMYTSLSGGRLI